MSEALKKAKYTEGRSASFFCFSPDKKFIIKTVPESEALELIRILPYYYRHLDENRNSLLIRFFGLHAIRMLHSEIIYIVVMSNVFDNNLKIDETYDLKGSWINRGGKSGWNKGQLGKDNDLKRVLNVGKNTKKKILSVIKKDIEVLRDLNIMDYSLLLGIQHNVDVKDDDSLLIQLEDFPEDNTIDKFSVNEDSKEEIGSEEEDTTDYSVIKSVDGRHTYCFGLIDILQHYNADKKTERCCKVYFLCKKEEGLSCVEPEYYCERFFMKMGFIMR